MKLKFVIIIFLLFNTIKAQEMNFHIIPIPQNIIKPKLNKIFQVGEFINVTSSDLNNKMINKSVNLLNSELENFIGKIHSQKNGTLIELVLINEFSPDLKIPENFWDESYLLQLNEGNIKISATSTKGIFYASQTLIQLLELNNGTLQECEIVDYPDMHIRGVSDDISRGQVSTLENFKRIIRFISRYKMNTYMPYLEDMIEFDSYPSIGKNRGALTKDEITELVNYADEYFIDVVPIFQTLGHFENILSQPEYIDYADFPGAASLDVTQEKTYTFIETLLKEVFELFPSKYFHIGADESYDVGLGKSKTLLINSNLATIHANHYKRIYDICKKHNKEVMMYGDILLNHPEILGQIPNDITIVDWHYFPRFEYPSTKTFNNAGFKFIVSPTVWNFNATFPENFFAVPNIKAFTKSGIEENSIGMINSSWGDYGAESSRELNLYGYAWSAQCSWNISESNIYLFEESFFKDFYGSDNEYISDIYRELSSPTNQVLWNELWRHPLFEHRKPDWRSQSFPTPSKLYWMQKDELENKIQEAKQSISKNKLHFILLEFACELRNYFALKLKTQELLHKRQSGNKEHDKDIGILIESNISSLKNLKIEFRDNWLKYNKEANLWMVEEKFDRLIEYFSEVNDQIKSDSLQSPEIESKCIYYPCDKDSTVNNAQFKKTFMFEPSIESAYLQFFADGHAKLAINNKFVDEVYVKRSGSLWLEQQRVKLIDIKNYLVIGENEIKISVDNYKKRNACVNIIAQIKTDNSVIKISSDSTWLSNDYKSNDWINASIEETAKLNIVAPNFEKLRKSWIER